MKTLQQLLDSGITGQIYLAKKGKKYVTIRNGELALSDVQREAVAGKYRNDLDDLFAQAEADDQNAKFAPQGFVPIIVR